MCFKLYIKWRRKYLKGGGTLRDWEPDLMGLGPTQGPGSGKVAGKVGGGNQDFLKSGGRVWPGRPPPPGFPGSGAPVFIYIEVHSLD